MTATTSAFGDRGQPINGSAASKSARALVAVDTDGVDIVVESIQNADPKMHVLAVDSTTSALALVNDHPSLDLAVLEFDALDQAGLDYVLTLCCDRPELAIALRSETLPASTTLQLFGAGIRGILPRAMSRRPLTAVLTLILAGEPYMPPCMMVPAWAQQDDPAGTSPRVLSRRESDVARLLSQGQTNKEIARKLGVSEVTVKVHMTSILRKLGARNRTEATLRLLAERSEATPILHGGL